MPSPTTTVIFKYAALCAALLSFAACRPQTTPSKPIPTETTEAKRPDDSVEKRVHAIVVEQLGLKETPRNDQRFIEDLRADSLDLVELVMAFEEEFRVEIPDATAEKLKTVGDAIRFLEGSLAPKQRTQ